MEPLECSGGTVFKERQKLYTKSFAPGTRVYGERLKVVNKTEYREWSPNRSKLAAYLINGGLCLPICNNSTVLYLGASSGTTPSHVSDIASNGKVFCVEFAPRMFRQLVRNCVPRKNMMPVLADATRPSDYEFMTCSADVVYEDVAQKHQADIAADNMKMCGARYGMIAVKARSEDVTKSPVKVFRETEKTLKDRGYRILDARSLEPFEDSHEMIVFEKAL